MSLVETVSANGQFKLLVHETWCKGCRICVDLCPTKTLAMVESPDRWEGSIVKVTIWKHVMVAASAKRNVPILQSASSLKAKANQQQEVRHDPQ